MKNRRSSSLASCLLGTLALTACQAELFDVGRTSAEVCTVEPPSPTTCGAVAAPPADFSDFVAADDAVALDALLEASGHGWANFRWVDAAAGNFCGGAEQELLVVQNTSPFFSILRGPSPFVVGTANLGSSATHPWTAVAAGNFDLDPYDEIVAVRTVTASGVPDVMIIDVDSQCTPSALSTRAIGGPGNSGWVDVAVGNFDGGDRSEIALVKNTASYFVLMRFLAIGPSKTWQSVLTANLGTRSQYPWKALAAGNLDGVPGDELVAVRQVNDGVGDTVRAYRWDASAAGFALMATSTFANTGNHVWLSATAGNFGGDGREAIALVKNKHSSFVTLDYPPGAGSTLRLLAGNDLDTAPGQTWRSLVAVDWLDGDAGHDELMAVRELVPDPDDIDGYQTDFFVYGNGFHRARRQDALADTRAVIAGNEFLESEDPLVWAFLPVEVIRDRLVALHANTYNIELRLPGEYEFLLEFLEATKNLCVDGRQLRVWITLPGPSLVRKGYRAVPVDSERTCAIDEDAYFTTGGDPALDYIGWVSLISRLAQDYPHIVAVGIDDFLSIHNSPTFTPEYIAQLKSRLTWPSEWLSLVPTVYWEYFEDGQRFPDLPLTFDSMAFYFANQKHGVSSADDTVANATEEIEDMADLLADGRGVHVGVYTSEAILPSEPSVGYVHALLDVALAHPAVSGTTAYTGSSLWGESLPPETCEGPLVHDFCAVQSSYATGQ